ncbi:MAG: homoserine dehydrogenase [Fimbriiglobus sp.]
MAEALGVAILGCGTVGSGVVRILLEHPERLAGRSGRRLELRHVVVRDASKPRGDLPAMLLSTDPMPALKDPAVEIVVELIGGTTTARSLVLAALAAGKHVVTANKALLAEHGPELFAAARQAGRVICFEAAVAGGIPIIRALAESLAANQVTALQGILNGTSNFILTSMTDQGLTYEAALKEAQARGYAEADPTLDVDGSDAAHKLAVLAQIAFGVTAKPTDIEKIGIDRVDAMDIRFADELGYAIKLLAEAWTDQANVALHVAPVLLRHTDMLAQVRGAFNAVQVVGDLVGETLYQGPGAGMMPTASSVMSDILDIAIGRAQKTFAAAELWSAKDRGYKITPSEKVRSRFYLRLLVNDQPGVLADVCRILADSGISISSMIQHEPISETTRDPVPLVLMTHIAETGRFRSAVTQINKLPTMHLDAVYYSVDD